MKPTDIFTAILKALGVSVLVYAIAGLPQVIRYSPYFLNSDSPLSEPAVKATYSSSVNAYWQTTLAHTAILLVFGCCLLFKTNLFVRLAYGTATRENEIQQEASGALQP
jgi:hypothetical protein